MRSKLFPILVLILLCVLVGGLFACKAPVVVAPPTGVMIDGNVLVWDDVSNAIEYHVTIDDEDVVVVYEPRYVIELYDSIEHSLTVSVVTADGESAKSDPPQYYTRASDPSTALKLLAAPSMRISATRLMWNNVLGNSGYKIFFNNQTIEVAKNVTSYDLTFPSDGEYIIRMQTVGDGITYYSSQKSEIKATISSGKAKLLKLNAEAIRYDVASKKIVWNNKYSASSVRYQLYKDGVLEAEIDADASLATMSYAPILDGRTSYTYTMCLASNDGLYDTSLFSAGITFPISEPAVTGLHLEAEDGYYYFSWDKCQYASSYQLRIDGNTYSASEERIALPTGLAAGEHCAKVKAVGDGVYLGGSVSSAELAFTVGGGGIPMVRLSAPAIRFAILNEDHCLISIIPVDDATGYSVRVVKGEEKIEFTVNEPEFTLLRSSEDPTISALFTLLDAGGKLSVSAFSLYPMYLDSPYCGEMILAEDVEYVAAPASLTVYPGGVRWNELADVSEYALSVDGEVIVGRWTRYEPSFTTGEHVFKVAAAAENALYSEEIYVTLPLRLEAPSALQVTSGMLSYLPSENAASYELYADGVSIGQVSVATSVVDLSNYIEADGIYVLTMRAIAPSKYYADSFLSEEIVYEKTDGKFGTILKPYRVRTAEEFVSMIVADPSAYFTLTAAEYDFKEVDTSALSRLKFSGHIIGNRAVLKNIVTSTGLFDLIEGAEIVGSERVPEIADVTFEIKVYGFSYDGRGAFAKSIKSALLKNVTVVLTGSTTLTKESAFGLVAYEMTGVTLDTFTLDAKGLSVASSQKATVAGVAYKFSGVATSLSTKGTLSLTFGEIIFGGVSREGECTLTAPSLALATEFSASAAVVSGVTIAGRVELTGASIMSENRIRNAGNVTYYGVTKENVSIASSEVGGTLTVVDARFAEIYGITSGESGSVSDTISSLTLDCTATEQLTAAGISGQVKDGFTMVGVTFAGAFDIAAPRVQSAAIAVYADIPVTAKNAGSITASGAESVITGGVLYASGVDITFADGASLALSDVTSGVIIGTALESTAKVTVTGSIEISCAESREVSVSGVFGGTEGTVDVEELGITGDLHADKVSFGGVADATQILGGRIVGLSVDINVVSDDMRIGGAIGYAEAINLTERATVTSNVVANGVGQVAGFVAEMMNNTVENVLVQGNMSLTGEGELCGAICRAHGAVNIESRVSLTAKGSVRVSGLAGEIGEGSRLTVSKANLSLNSDQAKLYGVAASAISLSARVSEVSLTATPITDGGGTLDLYGITDALGGASGIQIEKTTFTIGRFYAANFAAVAGTAGGSLRSGALGYTLTCNAVNSVIGGAFGTASGLLDSYTVGTSSAPVEMQVKGTPVIGGIAADTGNLTVNKVSTNIRLSIDLPENATAKVGGAFATAQYTVEMTDTTIDFTLTSREGAGTAYVGGAVAELSGDLSGAQTRVTLASDVVSDVFGGIAAKMRGGSLTLSSAKGSISAQNAGGLVGNVSTGEGDTPQRPSIKQCATSLSMTGGAGLLYVAEKADIEECYVLGRTGAGLVYSATDLRLSDCYFGGIADYSLAYRAVGTTASGLLVEASLRGVPVQYAGDALVPTYKTLAYNNDVKALADVFDRETWTVSENAYPYLTALGAIGSLPTMGVTNLDPIEITDGFDLYAEPARRSVACDLPAVVWVDQSGKLLIEDGIVTLTDSGEGELRGYLSGGKLVYVLPYVVDSFEPFEGSGTELDPYVLDSFVNIKHLPRFANDYYDTNGTLAHFKFVAGTYEDVVFPSLTVSYAAKIDCNDVILVSPTVSAGGIFGRMTGGTVSSLTIQDPVFEDVLLFASIENVEVSDVNVRIALGNGRYTFIGEMSDSALSRSSFSIDEEGSDFSLFIADNTCRSAFEQVQFFLAASVAAPTASCSFVCTDDHSTFDRCAVYIAAEMREVYPFADTGVDTSVNNSAAIVYGLAGEKSACSEKKEMTLSDLTVRFCDCDLFFAEDSEDALSHKEKANISENVADAADDVAASFATFIANYTLTDASVLLKLTSPSTEYDDYSAFYADMRALFDLADTDVVGGVSYSLTSGAVIGLNKPFGILFGDDTTDALRALAARCFGYDSADDLAERVGSVTTMLTENVGGAAASDIASRVVYDGAIRTENNYFILPFAFVSADRVTLACVFVASDGTATLWLSDVAMAKKTANVDGGSMMFQTRITTEAYGRCSLFDTSAIAPVRRAMGVTYTDVVIAVNGEHDPIAGVTFETYDAVGSILSAAPYSFEGSSLPTPIGYEKFGREEDLGFTLRDDEGEVTSLTLDDVAEWDIYENWYIESDAPFGAAVGFSFPSALGTVTQDGILRVSANGEGTLTIRNVYGEERTVTVTVVNYYGFANGSGTESDPYEIHTLADLQAMGHFESAHFILKENVVATLSDPLNMNEGYLHGDGKTLRLTLDGTDHVFDECSGTIENLRFEIVVAETAGALMMTDCTALTLTDVTFALSDIELIVEEGATTGLLFGLLESGMGAWSGITLDLSDIMVTAPLGGTVGLFVGRIDTIEITDVDLTATVDISIGGTVVFGGMVGEYVTYENDVLLSDVTADVTLTASLSNENDELTLGGVIGVSTASVSDIDATVDITVGAVDQYRGIITLGGVVGRDTAALSNVTAESDIQVYAENASVGGIVGYANGMISNANAEVNVYAECAVRAIVGGIGGRMDSTLSNGSVTGNVTAIGHAEDSDLPALESQEDAILTVTAAGGAVGYMEGTIRCFTVSNVTVSSTASSVTHGYVLAGGAAGYLMNALNLAVDDANVTAVGADSVAGGAVAVLKKYMDYAVLSNITVLAATKGGAVGVFSLVQDASISYVFCTADVGAAGSAIVDHIVLTSTSDGLTGAVSDCLYLYGQAIGDIVASDYNVRNVKASAITQFYGTEPYDNENVTFDADVWAFQAYGLPTIKA